jgi:hypothetical protein
MEKVEIVKTILNQYGASTAKQISILAHIRLHEDISAASVSGTLRPLANKGEVVVSKNEKGANVYWLAD